MNGNLIWRLKIISERMILSWLILSVILSLSGCKPAREEPTELIPEITLEGTAWRLVAFLDGQSVTPLIPGTEITLSFADNLATGSAGCNSYGGKYSLERGSLSISGMDITERLCLEPEGVMVQEARYVAILQNVKTFDLDANQLTLTTADGIGLRFDYISP